MPDKACCAALGALEANPHMTGCAARGWATTGTENLAAARHDRHKALEDLWT